MKVSTEVVTFRFDFLLGILDLLWEREGVSPLSDVERHVIIRNLLDFIFSMLPIFTRRWKNSNLLTGNFPSVRLPTQCMTQTYSNYFFFS
jgi:hypothetical protein